MDAVAASTLLPALNATRCMTGIVTPDGMYWESGKLRSAVADSGRSLLANGKGVGRKPLIFIADNLHYRLVSGVDGGWRAG
jgi:hypothetical protein